MTKKLIYYTSLVIFLFIIKSCSPQDTKEIIDLKKILQKAHVDLENYDLVKESTIESYFEGFTISNSRDSVKLNKIIITKDISFNTYKYVPSDYRKFHDEYFSVGKNKITIDDIVQQNKINIKYYNPYFFLKKYYIFSKDTKTVVVIEAGNRTFYRDRSILSYFIIEIGGDFENVKLLYNINN